LLDEGGKVLKWYGTNADIEDRKRAEQKLRQNQSYLAYAQALSHSGNAIVKVSKGTFLWSEESARIYGYDPTILEPTAEMLMARIHPEDAAMVKDVLERAMGGGVTLDFEHRLLMPDGSVKHLHAVAHTVKDEAGNEEVLGAIVDVTKQKQIEEALRASERLARGQVEALRDILGFMSTEVNPDNFLEHVLFVTARQMDAHSLSVFSRNEDNTLTLEGLYLENKLIVPQEKTTYPTDDHPFWEECMKTGTECLVTELDRDPIWFRFVNRKNSEGAPRLNERTSSLVADAHTFIKAQGILLILAIPMVTCGRVSGFIRLMYTERREFLPVEMELCLSLAQQAALAMRLMQLSRKSQDAAVVSERNRLARDIHDTLAQGFTGIIAQLGSAQLAEASTHIERAESLARRSLDEARRSVQALRPLSLSNANLCEALKNMLETVGHYSLVKTEFVYEGESRPLSPEWEEVLLRVTQESLTNTMKHSKAQNFRATLKFEPEQVSLKLADDGCGFVPQAEHEGFGLIGMKERVNRIGGSFVVHSEPGAGTQTIVTLHSPSSSQLHAA
jgi:PAS domain S-box-containing protein